MSDPTAIAVHDLKRLCVVVPYVTDGNIYAPVIMLAETAADLIARRAPLEPDATAFYRHAPAAVH